jgi:hypothetical protein
MILQPVKPDAIWFGRKGMTPVYLEYEKLHHADFEPA